MGRVSKTTWAVSVLCSLSYLGNRTQGEAKHCLPEPPSIDLSIDSSRGVASGGSTGLEVRRPGSCLGNVGHRLAAPH